MLEKNENFDDLPLTDSHFHIFDLSRFQNFPEIFQKFADFSGCACALSKEEFEFSENFIKGGKSLSLASAAETASQATHSSGKNPATPSLSLSFGIHPQNPEENQLSYLETLLEENRIAAIGECGFDLFTEQYKSTLEKQKYVFASQLELAVKYQKPVIIHNRKAFSQIFSYSSILKNAVSVIFHGFSGGVFEAENLLKKDINAYFSFGKVLLRGSPKAEKCVSSLPFERILLETDSPFMTSKDEAFTSLSDIKKVYEKAYSIKSETETLSRESFSGKILQNYCKAYLKL